MANAAEKGDTWGVWRAAGVLATAGPTGGATVLADNIATVFEQDMSPEEARSFLTQSAVAQVAGTVVSAASSRAKGEGWTGKGRTKNSLKGITEKEIDAAINAEAESNVAVQLPVEGLKIETGTFDQSGQISKTSVQAKTSLPLPAKGNVKTTMKLHDADSTAPKGSTSSEQTTMSLEQAKGDRRVVPDATSKWGGRWIQKKSATSQEWGDAHIPLFKSPGGKVPFFPRGLIFPVIFSIEQIDKLALPGLLNSANVSTVTDPNNGNKYLQWRIF
jgi:hypothetical protein